MPTSTDPGNNSFVDVVVQPSYARNAALIRWNILPDLKDSVFYVLRSDNGRPPWKLLTPDGITTTVFHDTDFCYPEQMHIPHYRIVAEINGKEFDSPPVAAYDRLSRKQYGAVRNMLNLEMKRMKRGNGIEVVHFIPLYRGEANPAYNRVGLQIGLDHPETDVQSYDMPIKGGFGPGLWTMMEIGARKITEADRPDGTGTIRDIKTTARLLAFPQPELGHLLVHPPTDDRWIVTDQIMPYSFRGVAVIAYDVTLALLGNTDPRYRVPIPPRP